MGEPQATAGLDNPERRWMEKLVRIKSHPEWGILRVIRWFPAASGQAEMLRVFSSHLTAPQIAGTADVEVAENLGAPFT
jgi:hypothetical protein